MDTDTDTAADTDTAVGTRSDRGRDRGRAQPGVLADPLPPRAARHRGAGRVSLGAAGQARDAGLGNRAPRRPRGLISDMQTPAAGSGPGRGRAVSCRFVADQP